MRVDLPRFSMFAKTPVYEVGGELVFGLMRDPVVPDATDIAYTVPKAAEYRLDLIANEFYGVSELWWVIAMVNNIADPLVGAAPGSVIRVPTKERLSGEGIMNI
jgi:hypothetical protein